MGAKFLAAALPASILWYAWPGHFSRSSVGRICLTVFLVAFTAGLVGKVVGLALVARRRPLAASAK
jgi:hypothetical protein